MASLPDAASQDGSLGFTRGLMKTWHFPNFWQILLGCQLTQASQDPKNVEWLVLTKRGGEKFYLRNQIQMSKPIQYHTGPELMITAVIERLSLSAGSVPKCMLLLWRGPTYFSWHGTLNVEGGRGGEVTSRCVENHIILSLMSAAYISGMTLLLCLGRRVCFLVFLLGLFFPDGLSSSFKLC